MDALQDLLNNLPVRKAAKRSAATPMPQHCKDRYQQAHEYNFKAEYPQAYADSKYFAPKMPNCNKANGLQLAIIYFLTWNGHRATRVSSSGRMVKGKWIPGPTRKGASDVSATIFGKSVMLEIKVGTDRPRPEQLREQELERKAGGVYEFVKSFEEFLTIYDSL